MTDLDQPTDILLRDLVVDWPLTPPMRTVLVPDGAEFFLGRALLGIMGWNLLTSTPAIGPLLDAHIRWLQHRPKEAIAGWRLVCDEWSRDNRELGEQAWHAIWSQWMRVDPKAALRHWAELNRIDADDEAETLAVFKKAIKLGQGDQREMN